MFNPFTLDGIPNLTEIPYEFTEASIDPVFDAEMEDVEYHLAQYHRTLNQD
jgi:hypothetical protein